MPEIEHSSQVVRVEVLKELFSESQQAHGSPESLVLEDICLFKRSIPLHLDSGLNSSKYDLGMGRVRTGSLDSLNGMRNVSLL